MDFIKTFKEKVLGMEESFCIRESNYRIYSFMRCKVGRGYYIYGIWGVDDDFYTSFSCKPELMAIVIDEMIYIIDAYTFRNLAKESDIDNVVMLKDVLLQYDDKKEKIYQDFMDSLPDINIEDENIVDRCKANARRVSIYNDIELVVPKCGITIKKENIARDLCGISNFNSYILDCLNKNKEHYIEQKAAYKLTMKYIEQGMLSPLELKIINGIKSVDCKTVNVTFEHDGRTGVAKMEPSRILYIINANSTFSSYDFVNSRQAKKMIEELYDTKYIYNSGLSCKDILTITYGKKVLYTR